ncbi:DinB family protein [Herbiconiux moechotypicola]|uniref:DinB family protein n=1 Tax=Herbiconiux moechotypicola TaxID=637393 RepID=A0ABN3DW07_9MICO|nr:DinB family protein [Herbiconiux moechotypicola]MCS5730955.1 DinB family protein [Herbiconiux moechotypicola]
MPITPDTKNWTWVLERECPECGFDSSATRAAEVPALLRANAAAWPAVLGRDDVRVRPDDATWSPLEYAAHVRDVFRISQVRFGLMLDRELVDPEFPNWDQDVTAVEDNYNEQDPVAVAAEIGVEGEALAALLEAVPADAWNRQGLRSDGSLFTVDTLARYIIHDPVHHLHDVGGDRA